MDYTPVGVGRVLVAFALTFIAGVLPVAVVMINDGAATFALPGGYGVWVLGLGSVALALALIGLSRLSVASKRRVVGRPSRA